MVTDAVDYLARLSAQHAVHVVVLPPRMPSPAVEADAAAVFVLVKNLLENALHHSPPGSTITIALHADGFSVCDQGGGVAEADRPRLFERFWRGTARDGRGAGLGLSICLEICLSHGWTIRLEPAGGAPGACFVVETNGGLE